MPFFQKMRLKEIQIVETTLYGQKQLHFAHTPRIYRVLNSALNSTVSFYVTIYWPIFSGCRGQVKIFSCYDGQVRFSQAQSDTIFLKKEHFSEFVAIFASRKAMFICPCRYDACADITTTKPGRILWANSASGLRLSRLG